jgi:hypothetical protein
MNARNITVSLTLCCLLAALGLSSITAQADEISNAGNAASPGNPKALTKSYEDESNRMHEAVAKHYEDVAQDLQAKIQEQKQLLEQYESKSYIYGRQAQDLQSHAEALIRKYEEAAQANLKEAALHRRMASK